MKPDVPRIRWPVCEPDEQEAALRVLRSGKLNYWTGQEGKRFEAEFASYHDRRHALAVANGTVALELALQSLGVGPGDEVIVPPRTFIATASCVVRLGARPVFADVDRESQNMTAETVAACLTTRTKAIICVHLAGWPCEMDALTDLARERGLFLVEDCAQAHGARYRGKPVGSFGDAATFSFCQDKIMTTAGEGGMVLLDDDDAQRRAWSFRDHGKSWAAVHRSSSKPGFRWLHDSFGTNWRMTEVQSAIGRVQLRKLNTWIATRRRNANALDQALRDIEAIRIPTPPDHIEHAFYKWYVFVRPELLASSWDRDRLIAAIVGEGRDCYSGSCSEVYLEEAFPQEWRPDRRLPIARELGETSLMLLVDPTISVDCATETGRAVRKIVHQATRPSGAQAA